MYIRYNTPSRPPGGVLKKLPSGGRGEGRVYYIMKKTILGIITILLIFSLTGDNISASRWWWIFFTGNQKNSTHKLAPETALIRLIKQSRKRFYGSFYDISSQKIISELITAKKRGVDIRLALEDDNAHSEKIQDLLDNNIGIVSDKRRGLMHNKFAIIDEELIWTGSYNLTNNGGYRNDNNAISIRSRELAAIFLDEFREMFERKVFGNRKEAKIFSKLRQKHYVNIAGTPINIYFSPEDNIERILLKRIKKATSSIHFMAFSFTSDAIGEMIIKRFKSGIAVHGIFERHGANSKYSEYIKMKVEGIPVKLDRNRYTMHHKVIIIDKRLVITGSYNFSKNANKNNDENTLIIDNAEIAALYLKEFKRLYR